MNVNEVTALIITFNEAPNIDRCLDRLAWASRILVIDSGSTDATVSICQQRRQVKVIRRDFDSFAGQCNFGLSLVETGWVLSLDADYILPPNFDVELETLPADYEGFQAGFRYCIYGRPLSASLYPARTVLYRAARGRYEDIGHGHRLKINGTIGTLRSRIDHDDRKSLSRWLDSQRRYACREAMHLTESDQPVMPLPDRIRQRIWPAAPLVFLYVLILKRCLFDGWPGWFYALQRTYAELLLSLELLDLKLRPRDKGKSD